MLMVINKQFPKLTSIIYSLQPVSTKKDVKDPGKTM